MPEAGDQPAAAKPLRTWRPMALWTAGLLLVLGFIWFATAVMAPVWQVRAVLQHYPGETGSELCPIDHAQVVSDLERLGGARTAVGKIRLYLQMPRAIADKKQVAVLMLPSCDSDTTAAIPIITALTRDREEDVRHAAQKALEEIRCMEAKKLMLNHVVELLRESGYWRGYPLQSVKRDSKRQQWEFMFGDGRPDGGYAAYLTDETSDRIDILLLPPMWTKYERTKPLMKGSRPAEKIRGAAPAGK